MKVLVACEESQEVCKAFRKRGHEAYSCDIVDCSGGFPEWHLKQDVTPLLYDKWDLIIAFPPCTDLAVSGARHFEKKRLDGRQRKSIEFFAQFLNLDCKRVAIENPVGIISGSYIEKWFPDLAAKYGLPAKPTQIIQPYFFGDPFEKKTCLWLKGLPELKATNIVKPEDRIYYESGKSMPPWYANAYHLPKEERARVRSKTFTGIAEAMAEQWGGLT
ncbi:MAG: DNA cytosine methyltransferase [Clostridia bacterium]|nr:DNA cytosine methyltransferase [Clostridia bacterium]